jgi:hypothetical protein
MPHCDTCTCVPEWDCEECHGSVRPGYYCPNCGINRMNEPEDEA